MADKKIATDFNVNNAGIKIMEFDTPEEILSFIKGDERKTTLSAANARLKELGHEGLKQGQVNKITDDSKDFKCPGVEGKKVHVTGEDVIKNLRAKGYKI